MKNKKDDKSWVELPEGWEVRIISSLDEIEAIRPVWEKIQKSEPCSVIDSDIERYLSVLKATEKDVQPHIMILLNKGDPAAMVIAKIQNHEHAIKLGYKTLFRPKLKCLTIVYGGILGNPDKEICTFIVKSFIELLQNRQVEMIYFNHLKTDSFIYGLSRKLPGIFSRNYFPAVDPHWQTLLSDMPDEFAGMLSKKGKREIGRCIRNLEKSSGAVNIVNYHTKEETQEFLKIASQISELTYQKGIGQGVIRNTFTSELLNQAQKDGWLRAYVLFAGSVPLAFEYGCVYGDSYFAERAGFDPAFRSFSPGTILQLKIFEQLSKIDGVARYDYGFGDAEYKKKFGTVSWPETSIYIFAPQFYPVMINILDSSIKAVSYFLSVIAHRLGLAGKIKKWWRLRLQYSHTE